MNVHSVDICDDEWKCYEARSLAAFADLVKRNGTSFATIHAFRSIYGSIAFLKTAIDPISLIEFVGELKEKLMAEEVDKARGKVRQ